jgi:hypothetical protein
MGVERVRSTNGSTAPGPHVSHIPKPEGQVRLPDSPTTVTHPHLSQALGYLTEANKTIPIRERYQRARSHSHVAHKAFEEPVLRHLGSSTNRTNSSDSIHPYLRMRLTTASALPEVSASVPAIRVPDVGDPAVLNPQVDLSPQPLRSSIFLGPADPPCWLRCFPTSSGTASYPFSRGGNYERSGFKPERWGKSHSLDVQFTFHMARELKMNDVP